MATASYEGKAIMLSSWVSEGNNRMRTTPSPTTKFAEFYSIFLALGFCSFRNIFDRSTISDDFFESLRMLHEILAGDYTVFRFYLLFVSEDDEHLTIISEWRVKKTKLYLTETS